MKLNVSQELIKVLNDKLIKFDGLGGKFMTEIDYSISNNNSFYGMTLHIGYKTYGYSLGERLSKGLIVRSGLSFKLGHN